MANAAAFITGIALAGALASFLAGVVFSASTLKPSDSRLCWLGIAVWPLTRARLKGTNDQLARLNKALVACLTCLLVAAAAWSAAANLYRIAR